MVEISVDGERLVMEVQGCHRLWAFKSRMEIPLAHIRSIESDPTITLGWWKGLRAPGTHIPGVIVAGTFFQDRKRIFWDVHDPVNAIVIELDGERYDRLIVEVADPRAAMELIGSAASLER